MKTLVFLLMMTLSATLFASNLERDRFDHFEMIREMRQENSKKQQRVSERFVGRIRCANISHLKNQKCDLELLTEEGDVFGIDENKSLGRRHCTNHKDLMVELTAIKQPHFLFWGGALAVKEFEVLKEVKPEKIKNNINKRFEHLEGFDVGINL